MRLTHLISVALLGAGLFIGGTPEPLAASTQPSTKDVRNALRAFKRASSSELRNYKRSNSEAMQAFCDRIDEITRDMNSGSLNEEASADAVGDALGDLQDAVLGEADFVEFNLAGFGGSLIQSLCIIPQDIASGGCGTWDKFRESVDKEVAKARKKATKKLKKFQKAYDKKFPQPKPKPGEPVASPQPGVAIVVPPNQPQGGMAPGAQPPPGPKRPTVSSAIGTSSRPGEASGVILVKGTAEAGAEVEVSIQGPDGQVVKMTVTADNQCRWQVLFRGVAPGNYSILGRVGIHGDTSDATVRSSTRC